MALRLSTPYGVIPGSRPEGTFGAVLQMLLKARLDLRMDAGPEQYDEDVNAYLGGVLVSYIDPEYLSGISTVLSRCDVDLHLAIRRAMPDKSRIYRIYKVNADDMLLSLGIFRRLWQEEQPEMERIKQYYACAADCHKRIYGKPTAVAEIQEKLSVCTERYLAVLSQARKEYLHFVQQVSPEDLAEFGRQIHPE